MNQAGRASDTAFLASGKERDMKGITPQRFANSIMHYKVEPCNEGTRDKAKVEPCNEGNLTSSLDFSLSLKSGNP